MISDIKILKMNESHIKDVAILEKQCFSTPWSENSLRSELEKDNALFFVAFTKDEVSGYIGANNVLGEVFIDNLAVFSNYRNFGIGEALLKHLIEISKKQNCFSVTLEVRKSNIAARNLYEKSGFKECGTRKNFYTLPKEDGIIYTLNLGDVNDENSRY